MHRLTSALIAVGLALGVGPVLAKSEISRELAFDVLLDGDPIGTHSFRISEAAAGRTVESDASFDVRVLFVPVYSYRHSNTEVWRDGCLARVESRTDSNGKRYLVNGRRAADVYRISTQDATEQYQAGCLMSFAYWNPDILQQDRLLNAQTGELIDIQVQALGASTVEVRGQALPVDGYRIIGATRDVDITVYYHRDDGSWVALETVLDNGRVMRYRPASEPGAAGAEPSADRIAGQG